MPGVCIIVTVTISLEVENDLDHDQTLLNLKTENDLRDQSLKLSGSKRPLRPIPSI